MNAERVIWTRWRRARLFGRVTASLALAVLSACNAPERVGYEVPRLQERIRLDSQGILLIAAGGAASLAPESTLESAQRAFEAGADVWQIRVRLTRDGHLVVLHDPSLRRTTDVAYRFRNDPRAEHDYRARCFDLPEIRSLDAGSWWVHADPYGQIAADRVPVDDVAWFSYGRVRVPTLNEALELIRRRSWRAAVEVLEPEDADEDVALEILRIAEARQVLDRILIVSRNETLLAEVGRRHPTIPTVLIIEGDCPAPEQVAGLGALAVQVDHNVPEGAATRSPLMDDRLGDAIASLRRTRFGVHVRVESPSSLTLIDELLRSGASGIVTPAAGELEGPWRSSMAGGEPARSRIEWMRFPGDLSTL